MTLSVASGKGGVRLRRLRRMRRGSLIVDALPEYRGLIQSLIEKTMDLKHVGEY